VYVSGSGKESLAHSRERVNEATDSINSGGGGVYYYKSDYLFLMKDYAVLELFCKKCELNLKSNYF
jgi:hypothetical protein